MYPGAPLESQRMTGFPIAIALKRPITGDDRCPEPVSLPQHTRGRQERP
jgi:hypothetical protein